MEKTWETTRQIDTGGSTATVIERNPQIAERPPIVFPDDANVMNIQGTEVAVITAENGDQQLLVKGDAVEQLRITALVEGALNMNKKSFTVSNTDDRIIFSAGEIEPGKTRLESGDVEFAVNQLQTPVYADIVTDSISQAATGKARVRGA